MSDTPRTDAMCNTAEPWDDLSVLARELERELADEKAALANARLVIKIGDVAIGIVQRERAELRDDLAAKTSALETAQRECAAMRGAFDKINSCFVGWSESNLTASVAAITKAALSSTAGKGYARRDVLAECAGQMWEHGPAADFTEGERRQFLIARNNADAELARTEA